eukprot:1761267-Prymnesium_polylepis.1
MSQMVQVVSIEQVPMMFGSCSFQSNDVSGAQNSVFLFCARARQWEAPLSRRPTVSAHVHFCPSFQALPPQQQQRAQLQHPSDGCCPRTYVRAALFLFRARRAPGRRARHCTIPPCAGPPRRRILAVHTARRRRARGAGARTGWAVRARTLFSRHSNRTLLLSFTFHNLR